MDGVPRVCQPDEPVPPGHPFYVELTVLRNDNVQPTLFRSFRATRDGEYTHRCVCGHRGSGKSTELLRFAGPAAELGYFAVSMEVFEHLGTVPLEFADLCMLIVQQLERVLAEFGERMPADRVQDFAKWFSEIVREERDHSSSELQLEAEAQIGSTIPLLGKLIGKLQSGVKAGTTHATTVRTHLRQFPDSLLQRTNDLLDSANQTVRSLGYPRGLLLLFDQVDRYEPADVDHLFVQNHGLIRNLHCQAIYTIPIALHYQPISGRLDDCYDSVLEVPMVVLREKGTLWTTTVETSLHDDAAVQGMTKVLRCRVGLPLFEAEPDLARMVRLSGGCVRDLLHILRLAWEYSDERFTTEAVSRGIAHGCDSRL
ncbi:MAG: hypothetical protein FJX77_14580 [Armatimonadetes bacterium]|nr:hypothetical protein [Armatimonadota bacterium]